MLVYLDSAQIALLERASEEEVEDFFAAWDSYGAELVLSFHHLQEIAQYADAQRVNRRLTLLHRFPRVRSAMLGASQLIQIEVGEQLRSLLGQQRDVSAVSSWMIPYNIVPEDSTKLFPDDVHLQKMRDWHRYATTIENASKQFRPRATDLPADRDGYSVALREAEALRPNFSPEAQSPGFESPDWNAELAAELPPEVRHREVMVRVFQLQDLRWISKVPTVDFPLIAWFWIWVREEARRLQAEFHTDAEVLNDVVLRIDPYLGPGFSLQAAIARARRHHPKASVAGDMIDEQHIVFAPYVDIMVVDKRTLGFVRQEQAHRPDLLPGHVGNNIIRTKNLQDLICTLAGRA